MTERDYVKIAAVMAKLKRNIDLAGVMWEVTKAKGEMHEEVCKRLCRTLQDDNPRFDRQRFLTACGVEI